MQFIEVDAGLKEQWDLFVKSNAADGGILQSWAWGEFQKELGRKIFRVAHVDDEGALVAVALLVKYDLPFENGYLYCPRGPVVSKDFFDNSSVLLKEFRRIGEQEKIFMVRMDPAWHLETADTMIAWGLRKGLTDVQPRSSFIIDIQAGEEELLAVMKQKTRYNVNVAQKKGVTVRMSQEPSDVEHFWTLMKETSKRNDFTPHPKEYYKVLFRQLIKDDILQLMIAEYEGKVVAAHFVSFYGSMATYLHGASSVVYRGVMAPALLQWESILEAKRQGCSYYDFGGVVSPSYDNAAWKGISSFKYGFSPETPAQEYVGSYEQVLNPVVYSIYKFIRQIRG